MPVLIPPVDAPIVRPFHYTGSPFAAGHHRGVDLGAPAGEAVRAPCAGWVAHAGPTPGGGAVTLLCGRRRVTVLPVAGIRVRRGAAVGRGDVVAEVARGGGGGHAGLHLGVRHAHDRLAYVDPEPLLAAVPPPLGPAPPPSRRPARPGGPPAPPGPGPARVPAAVPGGAPAWTPVAVRGGASAWTPVAVRGGASAWTPVAVRGGASAWTPVAVRGGAPARTPDAVPVTSGEDGRLAPWPAWAGAALAVAAAFGAGRSRRRLRRVRGSAGPAAGPVAAERA